MKSNDKLRDALTRVDRVLCSRRNRLLASIAWPAEVERAFFEAGAKVLPRVKYEVDRADAQKRIDDLTALEQTLDGSGPVFEWLRATVRSHIDGNRLLLASGTTEFYKISRELYGGARTRFEGHGSRNIDLAVHLEARMKIHGWDEPRKAVPVKMTDAEFATWLREGAASQNPPIEFTVELDDSCASKVAAGTKRIRVRRGASFTRSEAQGLWEHEVRTHVLTAQNGASQPSAAFLGSGGPRTTRTQEGLAIFAELYGRHLDTRRLERLTTRVHMVEMAEQGANFLDVYRFLLERGREPRESFLDAQRVFRGGRLEGGAPFTKDVCYLAGLLEVFTFLSAIVRGGLRDESELLVAGRIALEDMPALVELRQRGLLDRPRHLPKWLAEWEFLLPYFAFSSFAAEIDLQVVEQRFARIIELAARQRAPETK